jgi:hypothetical protein
MDVALYLHLLLQNLATKDNIFNVSEALTQHFPTTSHVLLSSFNDPNVLLLAWVVVISGQFKNIIQFLHVVNRFELPHFSFLLLFHPILTLHSRVFSALG